ncbi:MAG: hypothetical protein EOP13_00120 [Pseudomonas sp.]|uniref:hypothetical protein n=1 Tax=Pseudomonas sp. TaxID=306 RepID=UPI00122A43E0|nr:hypothetical protein [Pseudomonas sp.]RZI76932.1 MAG: hypothetical protein EOP13_00120 [Pseudomonas sp.]
MRFNEEYRDYRIRYRRRRGWIANIWAPMSLFPLRDIPFATEAEGKGVIEQRTRKLIDAHIANLKGDQNR